MHVGGMRENRWWKGREDRTDKRGVNKGGRREVRGLSQLLFKKNEKKLTHLSLLILSPVRMIELLWSSQFCQVQWYSHTYSEIESELVKVKV